MPELPEVETVARDLQRGVAGAVITDVDVRWDRTVRHPEPPERFAAELRGARIQRVGRRAKSVLLHLADGRVMTVALRMTGALIVAPSGTPDDPYARVVFHLADGRQLRFRDVRKFGRIGLWEGGGLGRRAAAPGAASRAVRESRDPYRVGDRRVYLRGRSRLRSKPLVYSLLVVRHNANAVAVFVDGVEHCGVVFFDEPADAGKR